jgi:hypothetical protein
MRRRFCKASGLLVPALLISACSKAPDQAGESSAGIDVTGSRAAKGVAFDFSYDFILPARTISKVQRQHVTLCEQLGAGRCRISGIRYDQTAPDHATGSLDLLLSPADAYRTASAAVDTVEQAHGLIDRALVSGSDAAGAIDDARAAQEDTSTQIRQLEARLKQPKLTEAERMDITGRLDLLRQGAAEQARTEQDGQRSLTVTPIHMTYDSQGALTGENRFARAAAQSWSGLQDMLILVMVVAGYAIPWLLVGALAIYLTRRFQRYNRRHVEPAGEVSVASEPA